MGRLEIKLYESVWGLTMARAALLLFVLSHHLSLPQNQKEPITHSLDGAQNPPRPVSLLGDPPRLRPLNPTARISPNMPRPRCPVLIRF